MLRSIFIVLTFALFVTGLTGCSSSDAEKDTATVEGEMGAIDEAIGDEFGELDSGDAFAEGAQAAPAEGADPFATDGGGDPFAAEGSDTFAEGGSDPFAAEGDAAGGDPFAATEPTADAVPPVDEFGGGDAFADFAEEPAAGDQALAPVDDSILAPEESFDSAGTEIAEPEPMDMGGDSGLAPDEFAGLGQDTALPPMEGMDSEPSWVPVKKIASEPFWKNGVLVNAVYLARPGDTLASVSQKIYGQDKTSDLGKVNPTLTDGLKVGDKVYYNSPQRPNDSERLLTFYEDLGLKPEVYISTPGENIREVSERLLGDKSSWKEVWAINSDVESKMEIPEGTHLRYWTNTDISVASNNREEVAPSMGEQEMADAGEMAPPPMPDEPEAMEPPPPPTQAEIDIPPPPPSMPESENMPPPPPSQASIEPPPPPPPAPPRPQQNVENRKSAMSAAQQNEEQMMILGFGALFVLAAVVLFIIVRKRRARRELDFNTSTHTQIE